MTAVDTGRGVRFAPSPTGTFHLGNLRTAWISHWWARALGVPWVVRFEDIDRPRLVTGAAERQLVELQALGLIPDEYFMQTSRGTRHWALFAEAALRRQVYPCYCSRKEVLEALQNAASAAHQPEAVYDGRCRAFRGQPPSGRAMIAWRFQNDDPTGRDDFIVARSSLALAETLGNSGIAPQYDDSFSPAYHWACAVDDYDGTYDLLVRASDLVSATPRQRAVQTWIARSRNETLRFAAVFHCALVTGPAGERLEKRKRGVTLPEWLNAGWSAAQLANRFAASFRAQAATFSPGKIWGEDNPSISIAELLADR